MHALTWKNRKKHPSKFKWTHKLGTLCNQTHPTPPAHSLHTHTLAQMSTNTLIHTCVSEYTIPQLKNTVSQHLSVAAIAAAAAHRYGLSH